MAVPKKKMSRSRTRRRKAQWKVQRPTVSRCPQCKECGTYKGREVTPAS